jgi:EAL domain-containing protein (putative c-di-GMP-specific phosphodiesterase class I)
MAADPVDERLVKAIVDVARELRMETIAEFVPNDQTVRLLRNLGVDYGQGAHFGMPRPLAEVFAES